MGEKDGGVDYGRATSYAGKVGVPNVDGLYALFPFKPEMMRRRFGAGSPTQRNEIATVSLASEVFQSPGSLRRLLATESPFKKLGSPSPPSVSAALDLLGAIRKEPGAQEEDAGWSAMAASAAARMFEAGWINGSVHPKDQSEAWKSIVAGGRMDVAEAAISVGLRPCALGHGGWPGSGLGQAIEAGSMEMAKELSRAMGMVEAAQAAKSVGSMMFAALRSLDPGECDVEKELAELWGIWRVKGLSLEGRLDGKAAGPTALMSACAADGLQDWAVRPLLEMGASPLACGSDQRGPMHLLCLRLAPSPKQEQFRLDALRALVEAGADPLAKDVRGLTPIDLARAAGWDRGLAELARFEQKQEIGQSVMDEALRLGLGLLEMRRQGFELRGPDGSLVGWGDAVEKAKQAAPRRGRSL